MKEIVICFIIRTQGKRPTLLLEAISSASEQVHNKKILIVNHSSEELSIDIDIFKKDELIILNCSNINKKRGAPLNYALRFMLKSEIQFSHFCFLDDDDIVYKNFSVDLLLAQHKHNNFVTYGKSMKKTGQLKPMHAFGERPIFELLINNFIPINSYIVNFNSFKMNPIFFDETIDFLEDWKFLVELYLSNNNFGFCDSYVCEFRQHIDGSNSLSPLTEKRWKQCEQSIESLICNRMFGKFSSDYIQFIGVLRKKREIDFHNASMIALNKQPSLLRKIVNKILTLRLKYF